MSKRTTRALEIFQPHPQAPLGNCAEAVFRAFEPDHDARPADERAYRRLARGRAPGGVCGAYYAGADILRRRRPDLLADFERTFRARGGCVTCRSIRRGRMAECRDCVFATAEYLEDALPNDDTSQAT